MMRSNVGIDINYLCLTRLEDFQSSVAMVEDLMQQLQNENLTSEEYKDLQNKFQVRNLNHGDDSYALALLVICKSLLLICFYVFCVCAWFAKIEIRKSLLQIATVLCHKNSRNQESAKN